MFLVDFVVDHDADLSFTEIADLVGRAILALSDSVVLEVWLVLDVAPPAYDAFGEVAAMLVLVQ